MFHQNNKTAKQHQQCLKKTANTVACGNGNEARIDPEMRHGRETQLKI